MKTLRSKGGPFAERPYYTVREVEEVCSEELRKFDLYPKSPEPIRVERFIEKRFGITVEYDDLPDGVLGWTRFGKSGVEAIVVARSLSEEGGVVAERRVNSTLAHEAGHGLLHGHLFVLGADHGSLFPDGQDVETHRILCRDAQTDTEKPRGYSGRWWEFQANQAMGALLLPRNLVEKCLASFLVSRGSLGAIGLPAERREEAVRLLADTFAVNPIVARIRLGDLYPVAADHQLTL
jgi:hypothetical protein